MKVIKSLSELIKNKDKIVAMDKSNYQQTYENIYSIHLSNKTAITFLDDNFLTTFVKRNDDIYECSLNIEPIVTTKANQKQYLSYIETIYQKLKHTLYFPLVYETSTFFKFLKEKLYKYERLYTSIVNYKLLNNGIIDKVLSSNRVFFSMRSVKKFENNFYIKYYEHVDMKKILLEIEKESWKYLVGQDMSSKKEQLNYYSELIKQGVARIAVAYLKNTDEIAAYRIDAEFNNKICVLKNSYKEKFKKYSLGSYMLIYDLYNHYPDCDYVDLYGGPGLAKEMIETDKIKRYDLLYGDENIIKNLEINRKKWDYKNYKNYIDGNSIKNVFQKKENILVATSCFGLGPVGKLNSIIETAKDEFNWYASGEKFDFNILDTPNIFKDTCFTLDKEEIKEFIRKNNIKYAIVVLKNKMAHILKDLNVKVIYVDSLPFMWSEDDAKEGKLPYEVDCYCAQKTLELSEKSKKFFAKVENLHWINPIINVEKFKSIKDKKKKIDYVLINLGGLHSPNTDGIDYVDVVLIPLLELLKSKKVYITTSSSSREMLKEYLHSFKNVEVVTLEQNLFLKYIKDCELFFTSPGLTTIIESSILREDAIFMPPQNISQFYNIEYAKQVFKYYKEITWNNEKLTLNGLNEILDKDEKSVIQNINKEIKIMNNKDDILDYKEYLCSILKQKNKENLSNKNNTYNGSEQVINMLKQIIKEENNEKNIFS